MQKLLKMLDDLDVASKMVKEACPDTWRDQMRIYRLMIEDKRKTQPNVLIAALVLADKYPENDTTRAWIYATALDMIEEG